MRALNPNPIPFIKASRDPHTNLANVRLVQEKNGFDERVKKILLAPKNELYDKAVGHDPLHVRAT